jgi:hypothetical protein
MPIINEAIILEKMFLYGKYDRLLDPGRLNLLVMGGGCGPKIRPTIFTSFSITSPSARLITRRPFNRSALLHRKWSDLDAWLSVCQSLSDILSPGRHNHAPPRLQLLDDLSGRLARLFDKRVV